MTSCHQEFYPSTLTCDILTCERLQVTQNLRSTNRELNIPASHGSMLTLHMDIYIYSPPTEPLAGFSVKLDVNYTRYKKALIKEYPCLFLCNNLYSINRNAITIFRHECRVKKATAILSNIYLDICFKLNYST